MKPKKKPLTPGQISALKRRAGKKSTSNPRNNPVHPQGVKRPK